MNILDRLEQVGADTVAEFENLLGYPVYPWHEYVEVMPIGGDGRIFRCSWRTPQVLGWLKHHGVTDVLNLCAERSDADQVWAQDMESWWVPIDDGDVPTSTDCQYALFCLDSTRCENGILAYGCEAGIGRTGCITALFQVRRYKWTAEAALVDAERHGTLMPRQIDWILGLRL